MLLPRLPGGHRLHAGARGSPLLEEAKSTQPKTIRQHHLFTIRLNLCRHWPVSDTSDRGLRIGAKGGVAFREAVGAGER